MTAAVYLWQADGPRQGGRGVSGELESAKLAAEGRLRSGTATAALVEEATSELGVGTLAEGYCPTGDAWLAEAAPGGGISWVRVTVELAAL